MNDAQQVQQAAERIGEFVHRTPIVTSRLLNQWMGHDLFFKAECQQRIGAFKARGGCNAISVAVEQSSFSAASGKRLERVVANSSGNHAQAIAWAAALHGVNASIYMPADVSEVKAQATACYGAEVVLCADRAEADAAVASASQETATVWIPPYDHRDVIAGQGTAALEAFRQVDDIDAVFAPCGGGGLLSGTLIAARAQPKTVDVIGVEPLAANDAAQSIRSGKIVHLERSPDTLADGARTLAVGELTFEYLRQLDGFYEVSEQRIAYWTQWLTHLLKLNIEPTSAMVMQGVADWISEHANHPRRRLLVILSGGNLDADTRRQIWAQEYLGELPGQGQAICND